VVFETEGLAATIRIRFRLSALVTFRFALTSGSSLSG
jgi:hypothetical protein